MRVVGGQWGGRKLRAPRGRTTRPTTERAREGTFDMLTSRVSSYDDLVVLDSFAGSGAMGIEALSRGACRAVFCERDRAALDALAHNLELVDAVDSRIVRGDVVRLAASGRLPGGPFSLLLLDPPFRMTPAQVKALVGCLLETGQLEGDAVACYEHSSAVEAEWPESFAALVARAYGDTTISIARRVETSE